MKLKFSKKGTVYNRDLFKPGELTKWVSELLCEVNTFKLTTSEYSRLPSLFNFDPKETHVLSLDDDQVILSAENKEILGSDLKSLVMLMYLKPRSFYLKNDKPYVHESFFSGGVPIPLLGFKRHQGISYDAWRTSCKCNAYINEEGELVAWEDDVEKCFKLDVYLGRLLASTEVKDDVVDWKGGYGLFLMSTSKLIMDAGLVKSFRDSTSPGAYRASKITGKKMLKEEAPEHLALYNSLSKDMRLMFIQHWIWYGKHRCSDMIMDHTNWDNEPRSFDGVDNLFKGLEPSTQLYQKFGLKI